MKENFIYSEFLRVSKELGVPVKKVSDMFYLLRDGEPEGNNALLKRLGVSKNVLNQVKKMLAPFFSPSSSVTGLVFDKLQEVRECFEEGYQVEENMYRFLEDEDFRKVLENLKNLERPSPRRDLDQFPATLETVARRATLLNFFGDLREKKLLFIGDEDYTSVAVASLGSPKEISVLDIDQRVLEGIEDSSKKISAQIYTFLYDARSVLPAKFRDKFDVVFTDPPYTANGVKLFVSRAIECLSMENNSGRIYVCYGNSDRAKERFLPIYDVFVSLGLMIRWVFDKFNRYDGAESIGDSSSLFVCEVTPRIKSLVEERTFTDSIYTNQL